MTAKQRQCLLGYLGYYSGHLDGIWGEQSRKATEAFQRDYGLTADGIFGMGTEKRILEVIVSGEKPSVEEAPKEETTGTYWDEIKYFHREEFRCQCKGKYCNGFPTEPEEKLVRTVDRIREVLGVPISIVDAGGSGVRCERHNKNVGGVVNSQHLYGRAADLHSTASPAAMKAAAEQVMGNTGGIGLYSWGGHRKV